jgi:hypothetical protein
MKTIKLVLVILFSIACASCGGGSGSGGGNPPTIPNYTLTVTKSAADAGTVTSSPSGISCDTTCSTQSASFTSGTVTLSVTPNTTLSAIFTGWNGGGCDGVKSCSVTLSSNTSIGADFIAMSSNQLGLFIVSFGGSGTDFFGYDGSGNPITIDSTQYLFSEIIPSAKQWAVLDSYTSESYAASNMAAFRQDDQVFEVVEAVPLPTQCDFKTFFNPNNVSLTSFRLGDGDLGANSIFGWEMNHVGIAGGNVYYKVPVEWDPFHLAYDLGGEYDMLPAAGGNAATLLGQKDPDNGATIDVVDHGTLYAVFHDSTNAILKVWTRDLTTGKLATQLRNYTVNETDTQNWSFNINNGILYGANGIKSDGSVQIWDTDLSIPLASQTAPILIQTYPSSTGELYQWSVHNGHVVMSFVPSSSHLASTIADLDTKTGSTQYYDMGSKTNVLSFVPVWINGSSSASGSHAVSTRHRSAKAFVPLTTVWPLEQRRSYSIDVASGSLSEIAGSPYTSQSRSR